VDNRVRQAFRLMVDREQIIKTVLRGYGKLGNDLFSPFDPNFAREIPQRPYDPEKAKFLLKQAGRANLVVSLYTGDAGPGMLDSSILIAQQARKVGVTIKLDKVPADQYYTLRYMKAPFESTDWGQHPLDTQVAQSLNSDAPYNETDWKRPAFDKITSEARRTLNPRKRHELWVEAQRMLWDQGGYIIWGFADYIDAYSAKVHGLKPSSVRPLGWYTFTDVYLA
jgi:peptide/nickel transport system substrate-binding protein